MKLRIFWVVEEGEQGAGGGVGVGGRADAKVYSSSSSHLRFSLQHRKEESQSLLCLQMFKINHYVNKNN